MKLTRKPAAAQGNLGENMWQRVEAVAMYNSRRRFNKPNLSQRNKYTKMNHHNQRLVEPLLQSFLNYKCGPAINWNLGFQEFWQIYIRINSDLVHLLKIIIKIISGKCNLKRNTTAINRQYGLYNSNVDNNLLILIDRYDIIVHLHPPFNLKPIIMLNN